MTHEMARTVVLSGLFAGIVVWMWSVARSRAMIERGGPKPISKETFEVAGDPETLARRIASALTMSGNLFFAPMRIESVESGKVRFRGPSGFPMIPFFADLEGEFSIEIAGHQETRVSYSTNNGVEKRAGKIALMLSLLVGLPLVVLVGGLLTIFVVDSPDENVRRQAVQIVQIVHGLWPPFLIHYLGKRFQRMVEEGLGQVVDRLRFSFDNH